MMMNLEEIKKILPHRYPFLLVDRVLEVQKGKYCKAFKNISGNEEVFQGHFPSQAVLPGVMIIEALAQTAGIVVSESLDEYDEKSVLFMSVNKAKFRKPVLPNDIINLEVNFLNKVKSVYKFYGEANKDNTKVAELEFSAMITYK